MGCRANYVIVENDYATAFYSRGGAMYSVFNFAEGIDQCMECLRSELETKELLDWSSAEGGYLIDIHRRVAIGFGKPAAGLNDPYLQRIALPKRTAVLRAFHRGPAEFLQSIAPAWRGWELIWDDRGVDAFGEYLQRHNIHSIAVPPASAPSSIAPPTHYQA